MDDLASFASENVLESKARAKVVPETADDIGVSIIDTEDLKVMESDDRILDWIRLEARLSYRTYKIPYVTEKLRLTNRPTARTGNFPKCDA